MDPNEAFSHVKVDAPLSDVGWDLTDGRSVNVYRSYSSGYFDLVITDECHRSIYASGPAG